MAPLGCPVQRCEASGAAAPGPEAPQAEPNGTDGEKNSEIILAPQKWKFWTLWPLKLHVLRPSSWLKQPCEPRWHSGCGFTLNQNHIESSRARMLEYWNLQANALALVQPLVCGKMRKIKKFHSEFSQDGLDNKLKDTRQIHLFLGHPRI